MEKMTTILTFIAGFLSCFLIIYSLSFINLEKPLELGGLKQVSTLSNETSPGDWISSNQIQVYSDKLIIDISGISISNYAPTGSMRPVFDAGHNGIRIVPTNENQLKMGDIISFQKGSDLIVHRIVDKGLDENGIYFITKGDNNLQSDERVYFKDIKYVTIGILY
jgi:signal peptidase I